MQNFLILIFRHETERLSEYYRDSDPLFTFLWPNWFKT